MVRRIVVLFTALLSLGQLGAAKVERYTVRAEAPELEVNTRGEVRLVIEAAAQHVLDPKFPAEADVRANVGDDALVVEKGKLRRSDAAYAKDGRSMAWTVGLMARRAGAHPLRARMTFRVCDDIDECHTETAELELRIVVKD